MRDEWARGLFEIDLLWIKHVLDAIEIFRTDILYRGHFSRLKLRLNQLLIEF